MANENDNNSGGMPPPRKRKSTHFSVKDKLDIVNTFKAYFCEHPHATKNNLVESTAKACGVATSSVYKVLHEYKENRVVRPPAAYRRQKAILDNVTEEEKNGIIRLVHSFSSRNELPTIRKLVAALKEHDELPTLKKSTLQRLLKELNLSSTVVRPNEDLATVQPGDIEMETAETNGTNLFCKEESIHIYKEEVQVKDEPLDELDDFLDQNHAVPGFLNQEESKNLPVKAEPTDEPIRGPVSQLPQLTKHNSFIQNSPAASALNPTLHWSSPKSAEMPLLKKSVSSSEELQESSRILFSNQVSESPEDELDGLTKL